jgi:site-specific DNA-methyltransferase (adenine-specific)
MQLLVRLFSNKGELILDPFAGSGTTGVAALRLGRRFLGWELNAVYVAVARKRLATAREQLELGL